MKKIKNFLFIVLAIIIVSPLFLLYLDLINVSDSNSNITSTYDWLSFFGSYISAVATSILGLATISITIRFSDQTSKIAEDDLKANCYSEIIIRNEQNFEKINYKDGYNYQFKFKIADKNKKILSKLKVKKIVIMEHDSGEILYFQDYDNYEINLEYTPENKISIDETTEEFYFARINISKQCEIILEHKEKYVKIEIDAEISNVFNVVTGRKYILVVNDISKSTVGKVEYIVTKRFHDFSLEPTVYYNKNFDI